MVRRHHAQDDLGPLDRVGQIRYHLNILGKLKAGEKNVVNAGM